jgi:hypothetical protein
MSLLRIWPADYPSNRLPHANHIFLSFPVLIAAGERLIHFSNFIGQVANISTERPD